MGVLNDARCYSSCEVFSGAIQGHGAGTIFGEDERTGGGGAAVLKLDPFLIPQTPLPNTQYDRIAERLARIGQEERSELQVCRCSRQTATSVPFPLWQLHEDQQSWVYFEGLSDSVGLYQSPTTASKNGWNNLKGPWMIGNGISMLKMSIPPLRPFFTAPVGTKINIGIDVTLDSEPRL
ncbi:hypothetical protein BASA83_007115 [Batrachochytrium salamandrivorans]|nr:hypothetical protein BASA83_007115 [Batrachochytrium salamandrivorans]